MTPLYCCGFLEAIALIGALGMAGYFLRIRHILAKFLSLVMVVLAFTALTFLTRTIITLLGWPYPVWHIWLRAANATLLAMLPIILYWAFWRWTNGRHRP